MALGSNISNRINALLSTRQRQSYALVAITAFVALVLIGIGVFPIISSILYQLEQNGQKNEILVRMQTKEQNLRTLISAERQKREVTLALNAALPDTLMQSDFVESVNEIASKNQITLVFISFSEIQERRILREVFNLAVDMQGKTVAIGAYGSRAGLQTLLADLEDLRRVTNTMSYTLARREDNELEEIQQGQEYNLTMQAEIYFTEE